MSNNEQENTQLNDKLAESLLQVNKLLYKMPPQIGISSSKKIVTDFFQQSSYANGETMVLDSQTGSQFVDGQSSYLRLNLRTSLVMDFASGSSANLINRIVVRSRTGRELTRLEDANLITRYLQRYNCPTDWFNTAGKSQGYPDNDFSANVSVGDGAGDMTGVNGCIYILPLHIIPFFNQVGNKLLPPQVMEGLRIEISLAHPDTALFGAVAGTYTVSKPVIQWDAYDLADQFKRKISEMASRQGLNLLHKEMFHTIVQNASSQFNFDVKKAASKALKSYVISRPTASVQNILTDSMASEAYKYTRYQCHIGSVYYPNQPLETPIITQDGNMESYYNTLYACDKLQCWNPCSVSPHTYTAGDAPLAGEISNDAMIAVNLNKSQVSDLNGMVVNNARALLWDVTFSDATNRRLDVYLQHLRAVKVFTSNVEVRD